MLTIAWIVVDFFVARLTLRHYDDQILKAARPVFAVAERRHVNAIVSTIPTLAMAERAMAWMLPECARRGAHRSIRARTSAIADRLVDWALKGFPDGHGMARRISILNFVLLEWLLPTNNKTFRTCPDLWQLSSPV